MRDPDAMTAVESEGGVVSVPWPLQWSRGARAAVERVGLRLSTLRGTWLDDSFLGVPWTDPHAGEASRRALVALIGRQAGACPGVLEVVAVEVRRAGTAWHISVVLRVQDLDGAVVEATLSADATDGYAIGAWSVVLVPLNPLFPIQAC